MMGIRNLHYPFVWVQIPVLSLPSCMNLGKYFAFSKPSLFSSVKWSRIIPTLLARLKFRLLTFIDSLVR